MSTRYIYTEKNDCQDCYKCIRECPVKAIKVEDQSASVIQESCVYCGNCVKSCPVEAKKVKEDISTVKFFLQQGKSVFVSLAPSFRAEFGNATDKQIIASLKQIGFTGVSETAIGAEIISEYTRKQLQKLPNGVYISPCCPATVELIKKYYPQHASHILPTDTPMLAHGKYLREKYGTQIKTVFIGPCVAKKKEAEKNKGAIDAVITFKRLKKWFDDEKIVPTNNISCGAQEFLPYPATKGKLFPIEGGMLQCIDAQKQEQNISYMSFSGTERLLPILNDLQSLHGEQKVFLELMACEGGCINGPSTSCNDSLAMKTMRLQQSAPLHKTMSPPVIKANIDNHYNYILPLEKETYSESQIKETLKSVGKRYHKDELNCGGCGYESCRDFVQAVLQQKAERKMCVSYMRRVAQDKATVLLQRMPYGVVIIDKNLQIVESNRNFATLLGRSASSIYDMQQGLEGENIKDLWPFAFYFENMLQAGAHSLEKDIKTENQFLHLSVFSLHGNHLLCAILRNLSAPELKREEIVKRSRTVIRENLKTVQKIAFYLGENASNMETLLNSIVDIQKEEA